MTDETNPIAELLDQLMYTAQDDEGMFDIREHPLRAIAAVQEQAKFFEQISRVLERALCARMTDGEEIEIDVTDLVPGGGKIMIKRHGDHLHLETDEPEAATTDEIEAYKESVAVLQAQIYADDFYVATYEAALVESGLTKEGIEAKQVDHPVLTEALNTFWLSLPDSTEIRRGPFFLLCDLCEGLVE